MELTEDLKRKIELVLGRNIRPDERGNVESLSNFSEGDISEIRSLGERSGVLAISFIRFRLNSNEDLNTVTTYYASVIQEGLSVEKWRNDAN
jgi:hypothetical protein